MRLCASLSRGVAAPLGCVIFSVSVEIYGFTPRAQGFLYVRGGDGITTLGVLRVLSKRWAAACQKGAFAVLSPGHTGFPKRAERSEGSDTTPVRNAPVSPCEPLCALLMAKASVYPLSSAKANVGRLCEKLKIGMRNGWGQRCDGNFWTIFAGTILGEKPNFTGRFSEW